MRKYETVIIIDPDLAAEGRDSFFEKLNDLIPQQGGFLVMLDDWGAKKLAYEIKKKTRGYYVRLEYCGMGPLVDEMERLFRIDDRILKYMTVLLEKDADVESIKEEIAQAKAQKEQADLQKEQADLQKKQADLPKEQVDLPKEQTDLPKEQTDLKGSAGEDESDADHKEETDSRPNQNDVLETESQNKEKE